VQLVRTLSDALTVVQDVLTFISTHHLVYNVQFKLLSASEVDEIVGNASVPTITGVFVEPLTMDDQTQALIAIL